MELEIRTEIESDSPRSKAKNGPKNLHPSQGAAQGMVPQGTRLTFADFSMQDLAAFFSLLPTVQRPVLDRTRIEGRFDFSLEVLPAPTEDVIAAKIALSQWDTIFSDVQQLGLRFEPSTGPIETLVVEHAEQPRADATYSNTPLQIGTGARAQPSRTRPQFDVVSIKPSVSDGIMNVRPLPGRLTADATLQILMQHAYGVQAFQVSGGPGWMATTRYEIEGKASMAANRDQLLLMLQAVLEDRFHLKNTSRNEGTARIYTRVEPRRSKAAGATERHVCGFRRRRGA